MRVEEIALKFLQENCQLRAALVARAGVVEPLYELHDCRVFAPHEVAETLVLARMDRLRGEQDILERLFFHDVPLG